MLALPASVFAVEVGLMAAADRERGRELDLMLNRLGSQDSFGIGRIVMLLRVLAGD